MLTPAQQQLKSRVHQTAGVWRNDSYRDAAGLVYSFDAALDYLANGLRIAPENLLAPRGGLPLP